MASREDRLQELLDRQEIEDCLKRYSRGLDRHDLELAKSAYHDDARDDHQAYVGSGHGLVDWATDFHSAYFDAHQHYLMNILIELEGDLAHAETYYIIGARKKDLGTFLGGGRYIDRLERRGGHWAIAERVCTTEWNVDPEVLKSWLPIQPHYAQDPSDPSYQRPLEITRDERAMSLDAEPG